GVVKSVSERAFQPWADAEAGGAAALECAPPKRLLQPLAHRVEVDPQLRQCLRIDLRGPCSRRQPARNRRVSRLGANTEPGEYTHRFAVRVADEHAQDVLGADVVVPEATRLFCTGREVSLRVGSGRLRSRAGTATVEQPHRSLRRFRRSPLPYF